MQHLVEQPPQQRPAAVAEPVESLEAQLEASIRTPPVGRVVRTALLTLGLSLVPLMGWATMTTMERAVLASGQLVPEGRRKTVNLLEAGILRRLSRVPRSGQRERPVIPWADLGGDTEHGRQVARVCGRGAEARPGGAWPVAGAG